MLNLYGSQGMGATGAGVNPGGNMTLQQIMAMMQGQGGGAPGGAPGGGGGAPPSPLAPGGAPTPMANYIGQMGGGAGGMQHPPMQMPPVAGNPAPDAAGAAGQPPAGMAGIMQQLQMLQAMKQGQNGVAPSGTPAGGAPIPGMPNTGGAGSMMPAWLQAMLNSGSYGSTGMGMAPPAGAGGMMTGGT